MKSHIKNGDKVVIISASFSEWITPWADKQGVEKVISSKMEIKNGKITGEILHNCYGEIKVDDLLKYYPKVKENYTIAYGDSKGDLPLLNFVDEGYFRKF